MSGDVYVKLGSGKAKKQGAGNKGALLDTAARAGIRVPRGVLILDTAWDQAVLFGFMDISGENIIIHSVQSLVRFFDLPKFERPVAVRSAFSVEDQPQSSLAGYFETVLHVDASDDEALVQALHKVLLSGVQRGGVFRRDILIMEMVDAKTAGVAFSEHEHGDDLVNYTEGTADKLLAGKIEGSSMPLAKLWRFESHLRGDSLSRWQHRLQILLRDVRRWMGDREWDIEWADDGDHCYLVQLRPVTRATRRNEAFTIANHKEILPDLPSTFMTSVIASCAAELFAYYRAFDKSLPATRPFIEVFYGRPYINLSLMSEMMRLWGLPTRLVTDNIGGDAGRVYGLNLWRVILKTIRLTLPRLAMAQLGAVKHAQQSTNELFKRIEDPGTTFTELIETLRWLYSHLVQEMFSLTAAIGPMLSLMRRMGVLEEHIGSRQTVATSMFTDLDALREVVALSAVMQEQLEHGQVPDHPKFTPLWEDYMARYGHRGIYESDIARPRYRENPSPLLKSLVLPPAQRLSTSDSLSLFGWLTLPLWWQGARTMRAREQWRHDVMIGFEKVRIGLMALAQNAVEQGIFPDTESLWMLRMDEVTQMDDSSPQVKWDAAFWQQRKAEIERLATYHLPDLLHRFDDLASYNQEVTGDSRRDRFSGIGLTAGEVHGRAWVLNEPAAELPEGFKQRYTILVARSVDAGWIPTFALVAGVVVETGGDLSHGSIILRELGLPAVTNVRHITQDVSTGDEITIYAESGLVERS